MREILARARPRHRRACHHAKRRDDGAQYRHPVIEYGRGSAGDRRRPSPPSPADERQRANAATGPSVGSGSSGCGTARRWPDGDLQGQDDELLGRAHGTCQPPPAAWRSGSTAPKVPVLCCRATFHGEEPIRASPHRRARRDLAERSSPRHQRYSARARPRCQFELGFAALRARS